MKIMEERRFTDWRKEWKLGCVLRMGAVLPVQPKRDIEKVDVSFSGFVMECGEFLSASVL